MCETASIIEFGEALPAGVRGTRYTGIIRHLSILRLKPSFRLKNRVKNSAICCSSVAHGLLILQAARKACRVFLRPRFSEREAVETKLHGETSQNLRIPRKSSEVVTVKYIRFFIFLLLLVISGCSVLQSSETFYRDHPPGPIRWHEYED